MPAITSMFYITTCKPNAYVIKFQHAIGKKIKLT